MQGVVAVRNVFRVAKWKIKKLNNKTNDKIDQIEKQKDNQDIHKDFTDIEKINREIKKEN